MGSNYVSYWEMISTILIWKVPLVWGRAMGLGRGMWLLLPVSRPCPGGAAPGSGHRLLLP